MSDLTSRMLKMSRCKHTTILDESPLFDEVEYAPMKALILNIAWSAKIKGGIHPGISMIAGPSRHFKSLLGLIAVRAYLDKYEDAICIFYDSEHGAGRDYWESLHIDPKRVIHCRIKNIEEMKNDIIGRLDEDKKDALTEKDRVIFFIDSVGSLASRKELADAKEGKEVADMTRAKALKAFWRMVTPYLNIYKMPLVAIAHTYKTQDRYPQDVVSGGTGNMLASNSLFIISRSKEKVEGALDGFTFKLKTEKSRFLKEGLIFPFKVTFSGGFSPFSGLFDVAIKTGHIKMVSSGWYSSVIGGIQSEKKQRKSDMENSKEFWIPILKDPGFNDSIYELFHHKVGSLMGNEK